MPRLYKDLIVNEVDHKARVNLVNRDGSIALHEVSVELASTVAQHGDTWGAKEANMLMKLGDDGIPQLRIEGYCTSTEVNELLKEKEPTFAKNNAFNKSFGTATGTVCQGNDSRLSDARPAKGGDAATVNSFTIAGIGTSPPGSLANNALYFVYE